jgi:hypothetical protein
LNHADKRGARRSPTLRGRQTPSSSIRGGIVARIAAKRGRQVGTTTSLFSPPL